MKKTLNKTNITSELSQSGFFRRSGQEQTTVDTQKTTQISKRSSNLLSKRLSKNVSNLPTGEAIEEVAFRLRKYPKARANGDIPVEWKKRLDDIAHERGVGKYDVVMYALGKFLGEI